MQAQDNHNCYCPEQIFDTEGLSTHKLAIWAALCHLIRPHSTNRYPFPLKRTGEKKNCGKSFVKLESCWAFLDQCCILRMQWCWKCDSVHFTSGDVSTCTVWRVTEFLTRPKGIRVTLTPLENTLIWGWLIAHTMLWFWLLAMWISVHHVTKHLVPPYYSMEYMWVTYVGSTDRFTFTLLLLLLLHCYDFILRCGSHFLQTQICFT